MSQIKFYDKIPDEAIKIRQKVFVEEQRFTNEFDEKDNTSTHIVVFENSIPIATARGYTINSHNAVLGRISVLKEYRGKGIGSLMVLALEDYFKQKNDIKTFIIYAQYDKVKFYESIGYKNTYEKVFEDDYLHYKMIKNN